MTTSFRSGSRTSVRRISAERLEQIDAKVADLKRMRRVLVHLVAECEHADLKRPCPIIATLSASVPMADATPSKSRRTRAAHIDH